MTRVINADKMIEDTEAMRQVSDAIMIDGIIKYINDNSEEIEEVRHAKWCGMGNNDTVFTCSNCRGAKCLKIHIPTCTIIFPKYCEECGAKMDLKEIKEHEI